MKILLINQGHTDNLGDQAILMVLKKILESDNEIVSLPFVPYENEQNLNFLIHSKETLTAFDKKSAEKCKNSLLLSKLKSLIPQEWRTLYNYKRIIESKINSRRFDFAIIGGGELIKGSSHPFFFSLIAWVDFLEKQGWPVFVSGVSCDAVFNEYEQRHLRRTLDKCRVITVRDRQSQKILRDLGVKCEYLPDIVFLYRRLYDRVFVSDKTIQSVFVYSFDELDFKNKFNYSREEYYSYYFKLIERSKNKMPLVLGYTTYNDYKETIRFAQYLNKMGVAYTIADIYEFSDLIAILKDSSQIISGRMHAMILGMQYCAKIIPVDVKEKIAVFRREWGLGDLEYDVISSKLESDFWQVLIDNHFITEGVIDEA